MCSGGYEKLDASIIWIETGEREAAILFEDIFGISPYNVTCDCCGSDYFVIEQEEPEISEGDFVVTLEDIELFKCGHKLEYKK